MLGQAILVVGGLVFHLLAGYDVQKEVGADQNVAAGLCFGGFLAAIGIIVRASLVGADSNLLVEAGITTVCAAAGIVLLVLVHLLVGRIFFAKSPLSKEVVQSKNVAAGAISAACSIGAAPLLAAAIAYQPGR